MGRAPWAVACEGEPTLPSDTTHGHTAMPVHLPFPLSKPPHPFPPLCALPPPANQLKSPASGS